MILTEFELYDIQKDGPSTVQPACNMQRPESNVSK